MDSFYPFPKIDKATWLDKITKDLKGKDPSILDWEVNPDFIVSAISHSEDLQQSHSATAKKNKGWEIGQEIHVKEIKAANNQALEALNFGIESIHFFLSETIDKAQLIELLEKINLEYISLSFSSSIEQVSLELNLQEYIALSYDPMKVRCRVYGSRIKLFEKKLSRGVDMLSRIAELLHTSNTHFIDLAANENFASLSVWKLNLSGQYFIDIASLRALRLMLDKMIDAYGWDFKPCIEVAINYPQDQEINTHRIAATSAAMSAVIGGTDRLYLNVGVGDFEDRISRNIQQLLKLESYLDQVQDPAAGSYYIEQLTDEIINRSWSLFQELEAKR